MVRGVEPQTSPASFPAANCHESRAPQSSARGHQERESWSTHEHRIIRPCHFLPAPFTSGSNGNTPDPSVQAPLPLSLWEAPWQTSRALSWQAACRYQATSTSPRRAPSRPSKGQEGPVTADGRRGFLVRGDGASTAGTAAQRTLFPREHHPLSPPGSGCHCPSLEGWRVEWPGQPPLYPVPF